MHKLKLRTKIEVVGIIFFLIVLAAVSVASVTRVITDSSDNSYSFIRNSKGNYWEAIGSNVQAAIDDLSSTNGGTVWVGSDVTLNTPLELRNDVIVNFCKNQVTLGSDISFVNATYTRYATVKNVNIKVTNGHTASVIMLYVGDDIQSGDGDDWVNRVRYNTFENINIINPNSNAHSYTGIHLKIDYDAQSNFLYNTFRDIQMFACGTGILLECDSTIGWGNGNLFENIWIDRFETMVDFDVSSRSNNGFNQNTFMHVKGQAHSYSVDGFKNIGNNGNHFDHCLVWDWWKTVNPSHEWSVSNTAYATYICTPGPIDIDDNGQNTTIVG